MKNSLYLAGVLFLTASVVAQAAEKKSCSTELVYEKIVACEDGNSSEPCVVERVKLGDLVANLTVLSSDRASGDIEFTGVDSATVRSQFSCALTTENGDVNDMECVSRAPLSKKIGKLYLSFNSAEAPYYVVAFTEFGNTPIGAFSTDECR